jgi:hypothetical protein
MIPNRLIQFRNREASILGLVGALIRLYVAEYLTAVSVPSAIVAASTGYFPAVCVSLWPGAGAATSPNCALPRTPERRLDFPATGQ